MASVKTIRTNCYVDVLLLNVLNVLCKRRARRQISIHRNNKVVLYCCCDVLCEQDNTVLKAVVAQEDRIGFIAVPNQTGCMAKGQHIVGVFLQQTDHRIVSRFRLAVRRSFFFKKVVVCGQSCDFVPHS